MQTGSIHLEHLLRRNLGVVLQYNFGVGVDQVCAFPVLDQAQALGKRWI